MSYASQLDKIIKVISSVDVENLYRVLVTGGRIYASDDRMVVSTPFDSDLEFFVDAVTLRSALQGQNVRLSMKGDNLTVKSDEGTNRLKSVEFEPFKRPQGDWREVPEHMLKAFAALAPFQAKDRTREWACAITVRDGNTYATNNRILGVWEGGDEDISTTFPNWLIGYILSHDENPTAFIVEELWIGFTFEDGTEIKSAQVGTVMPQDVIDMGNAIKRDSPLLPSSWEQAVSYVVDLPSCDTLKITPERIYTETFNGSRERLISSPTTKESLWDPVWLHRMAELATNVDFDKDPATWHGPDVKGLIIGKEV